MRVNVFIVLCLLVQVTVVHLKSSFWVVIPLRYPVGLMKEVVYSTVPFFSSLSSFLFCILCVVGFRETPGLTWVCGLLYVLE